MWVKNFTLDIIDKGKHYIKIKTHNTITLRFWCKTGVKYFNTNIMYNYMEPQSLNNHDCIHNPYMKNIYIYKPIKKFYIE